MRKLVVFIGLARSGKDTAVDYVSKEHRFSKAIFSDFIVKELVKRKIEPSRENMSIYGAKLREELGQDYLLKQVEEVILKHDKIVVGGMRAFWEYQYLSKRFPEMKVVLIKSSIKSRFARRREPEYTLKQFKERDARDEKVFSMSRVFAEADLVINNNGSLEEFLSKIDSALSKLGLL